MPTDTNAHYAQSQLFFYYQKKKNWLFYSMDLLKKFSNIFKTRKSDVKLSWHFKYNVVYKQAYELIICCM